MMALNWNMLLRNLFLRFSSKYKCHIQAKLCFIVIFEFLVMAEMRNSLPIDTIFKLPSSLPTWPSGNGFGSGTIDIGGLQVQKISTFNKIWTTYEGRPNNLGASFFEPCPIPNGFTMFGTYAQPNNQPLFGWVLVAKTDQLSDILKQPTDYTLVSTQMSLDPNGQNISAYFWLPISTYGYIAVGLLVTTSPDKPSVDKIKCVRSDFTDETENDNWIWGKEGLNVYGLRPKIRGIASQFVSAGTFLIQNTGSNIPSLPCLKNNNFNLSTMPNVIQIHKLFQTYSPSIYLHPKETHLPSSVYWYFSNGALLYKQGEESNPTYIESDSSNLPQGGSNDGSFWLDLPVDKNAKEMVKRGNLQTAEAYLHVKPMFGATFTDIQVWIFYPFNGHAVAKLGIIEEVPLGKIGEHVGDWEHVTLRISNFDGVLYKVYFAEHSGGTWIDTYDLEIATGNKFVVYSSLNGHASYYKMGLDLQGDKDIGIRNDTGKSDMVMDTGASYSVVAAEVGTTEDVVVEPPWINYAREWGPKISYDLASEVKRIEKFLFGKLKKAFEKFVNSLPEEVYGEEGPTGPKIKNSWTGDEK